MTRFFSAAGNFEKKQTGDEYGYGSTAPKSWCNLLLAIYNKKTTIELVAKWSLRFC